MTWKGNKDLEPLLVDIQLLEPHPGNPRRGNIPEIARSLERFGQQKPIVVRDGVIYAGRHVWEAALSIGFDQLAATGSDLTEEEAYAYLMADNRASDLAGYDAQALTRGLERLRKLTGGMGGTGWDPEKVTVQLAELRATAVDERVIRSGALETEHQCGRCGHRWEGNPRP